MSEIGFSYEAKTQPSKIGAKLKLKFANTTLRGVIEQIEPFVITLTPSGNVSEAILSGVAWPLAQTLGVILPPIAKELINGYRFDLVTISATTQTIEGETLTIKPSQLHLSNHKGMLMVQGAINIT